jgi:hypothetical protein
MRRITTGQTGDPLLGKLVVEDNTFSPRASGDSLQLSGNTVTVDVDFDVTDGNSVRIYSGSNYVDLNAPGLSSNVNFTLPSNTGTSGYVLRTDGSGNLSWVDVSFEVSNQTADTSTYYPLMSTSSSGSITGVTTTTGKLEFQPSSGTLTVTDIAATDGVFSNDLTVTNDFTAGTITETSSRDLKTDIEPIADAVAKIVSLDGVQYTRRASGKREAGLIAEEVERVLPELVDSQGEYKSISYSRLSAYLIEAVKTLKSQLDEVKG